ncbi:L,D-transpeptidase family protein [Novosphingobium flavum]|uniref:L,D-transpeptidase family protein n=1 Tax=Novosphingobium flavum TaxID=1778672 RepID=A0A7X1FV25_9SPHN|nr:L,D-transpeptidase family protein [Novosphingobium flavum]MBC2667510.1 L,D-transpeptidase family protein [Novosphingobium flavum]
MELRKRGWIGLVVAAIGLALVAMSLLSVGNPAPRKPAATAMQPIELATAPGSAAGAVEPALVAGAKPADPAFTIKRILPIDGPIRYGDWHWDEAGVPAGPLVITVDLDARVLSVFRGGYEIAATAVLLGTQDTPTPTGIFPITQKDAHHVSNIYEGAPMPFMMRLTNDGISIHGTTVENGYASHGCVGVPTPFARKLFGIAALGTPVYITRGKMAKLGDQLT